MTQCAGQDAFDSVKFISKIWHQSHWHISFHFSAGWLNQWSLQPISRTLIPLFWDARKNSIVLYICQILQIVSKSSAKFNGLNQDHCPLLPFRTMYWLPTKKFTNSKMVKSHQTKSNCLGMFSNPIYTRIGIDTTTSPLFALIGLLIVLIYYYIWLN